MLPKENRLKEKKVVSDVFKTGSIKRTSFFNIYKKSTSPPPQLLVVVSNKVSKKANQRNLIKRRIQDSFKELTPKIEPSAKLIVVANKKITEAGYQEIKEEIKNALTDKNGKKTTNSNN